MLKQGVDFEEKYASTVRWDSIKVLLGMACQFKLNVALFDIATFFLYGSLKIPVYMEIPTGWEPEGVTRETHVCKVVKSLYGLPQAPYHAQQELKKTLSHDGKDGMHATKSDDCVYVTDNETSGYAALGAHVDDLLCVGDDRGLAKVERSLLAKFKITSEKEPKVITGVQMERNIEAGWLKIHQGAYTTALLTKFGMENCTPVDTPMDPGTARSMMLLPVSEKPDPIVVNKYQRLVGSLVWLSVRTRPDLQFVISFLSRFLRTATQSHYDLAIGRPLRYLKGTITDGIVFVASIGKWVASAASDSDLAGCINTGRSTMGHYAKMGEYGVMISRCGLDRKISTSTGQAETYAMLGLVKDIVWLLGLLDELGHPMTQPVHLASDNDGVVKQSTKAVNHTTAKHYRIAQAYIREKVQCLVVKVVEIDTAVNASDIFTKALLAPAFLRHKSTIMGPQTRPL
jgi:hypothetical protein